MKKVTRIAAFYIVLFCFSSLSAAADTARLNKIAACSGVVVGYAALNYAAGDQQLFEDGLYSSVAALRSEKLHPGYGHSQLDWKFADQISGANADKIIALVNSNSIDEVALYEIADCHVHLARTILDNSAIIEQHNELIVEESEFLFQRLSAMLAATFD